MPIAYRTILTVASSSDIVDQVDRLVNDWLESKDLPRLGQPGTQRVTDKQLARADVSDPHFVARRWELKEVWAPPARGQRQLDGGAAVTSITVVRGNGNAWLWVDTDSPRIERELDDGRTVIEPQAAGTPRLVKGLIEALAPTDGRAEPFDGALSVTLPKQIDELLAILRDDTRIGAVFLSSPPAGVPNERWVDRVNSIVKGSEGMAVSYVVAPELLHQLNAQLGYPLSLRPGGLRTYLPGVVAGSVSDSYRHKAMAPRTLAASHPRRLGHILRSAQVARMHAHRLPLVLQAADYALLRELRRQPLADIDAIVERSTRANDDDNLAEIKAINAELVRELERQKADSLNATEEAVTLIEQLQSAEETAEILQLELDESEGLREEAADTVAALRTRLKRAQAFEDAYAPLDEDERTIYPDSFGDILSRMSEFPHLDYVGKEAHPLQLDEHPNIRPAAHKAWDALATLNDYARLTSSGDFGGGLLAYLGDPNHDGFNRLLNNRAGEGDGVHNNPKLAQQREVDIPGKGREMMSTHVALLNRRAGAPRLYYLDAVSEAGLVYIGYIGVHLMNAKFN